MVLFAYQTMAKPGRKPKVTDSIAEKIRGFSGRGMNVSQIARALKASGSPLSRRTIQRHLTRVGSDCSFLTASAAPEPPPSFEPAAPTSYDAAAGAALASDDLEAITRTCAEVEAAMRQWSTGIGFDPSSTRAYSSLARLSADLRTRMAALRPQPEVERERFAEFGHGAMTELVALARSRAETDWQGRYRRAMALSGES